MGVLNLLGKFVELHLAMFLLRDEECDSTIAFLDFLPTIESAETVNSSVDKETYLHRIFPITV